MSDALAKEAERLMMGRYEAEGMNVVDCVQGDIPVAASSEFLARTIAQAMNEADKRAIRVNP